jgi:cytochrome c551
VDVGGFPNLYPGNSTEGGADEMRPKHLLPALLLAAALVGCGGDGDDDGGNGGATSPPAQTSEPGRTGETTRTAPAVDAEEIFASNCSSCHVLAAADAGGVTGPNLDDLMPSADDVRNQVISGGGGMPSFEGDLSPEEIDAVSVYVADNAGR